MQDYQPLPGLLKNKVILVTGSTSGIGRCAAKNFAEHGATVILLGRNVKALEEIYDEIVQLRLAQPAIYPLDLARANPDQYVEMAKRLEENFGRLDGLLHNAAQLGTLTPIEHYDIALWYEVIQINLHSRFLSTRACLPLLRKSPRASVIFTTSEIGKTGKAYWGAYCVSKFGNEAMMQILADELDNTGIRINSINPGPVMTKLRAQAYPAEDKSNLATPDDIMPAYLYLMGADSQHLNGQSIDAQTYSHFPEATTESIQS